MRSEYDYIRQCRGCGRNRSLPILNCYLHFEVVVFWVVTPYRYVTGYQCFEGSRCLYLLPSQPRGPRLESSSPWKPQNLSLLCLRSPEMTERPRETAVSMRNRSIGPSKYRFRCMLPHDFCRRQRIAEKQIDTIVLKSWSTQETTRPVRIAVPGTAA